MLAEDVSTFGQNVKRIRKQRGMSATKLATALGVKQGTLSDWERDRRGLPEGPTLLKFAKELRCLLDDLVAGVDAEYDAVRHARPSVALTEDERAWIAGLQRVEEDARLSLLGVALAFPTRQTGEEKPPSGSPPAGPQASKRRPHAPS